MDKRRDLVVGKGEIEMSDVKIELREQIARIIIGPRDTKHLTAEKLEELRDIRWGWYRSDSQDALNAADAILEQIPDFIERMQEVSND